LAFAAFVVVPHERDTCLFDGVMEGEAVGWRVVETAVHAEGVIDVRRQAGVFGHLVAGGNLLVQ